LQVIEALCAQLEKQMIITPQEIIDFWFSDRVKSQWFASTPELDKEVMEKYEAIWEQAASGELDDWGDDPDGCLALVIILDQFPLNMFRGQAKSFKTEDKAVDVALTAVNEGLDQKIEKEKLAFLYMPFMHSEDLTNQDISVKLYKENNLDANIKFAEHHRDIIRKFGRFPHRNGILERESTAEEIVYLASKNAFKG
jgi:uncharacterized protein (DUF924 family)